ncbi:MAG: helix-turn-helix domain-containing protein [Clostridia bacterium]|nr:helix-turn-helix domain-containing protein [Clostridia bacterium]
MIINYYRQIFPKGNMVAVSSADAFREPSGQYYGDMLILRPKSDEERRLFLFSIGHEYCHPEKYFKQRRMKNRFMVHFIVKGSCYYNKQRLTAGDAFLLWPNKPHDLICVNDDPMEMYWVDLTGTQLEEYISQIGFSLDRPTFKYHFEDELREIFSRALYQANPKADVAEYYAGILKEFMSLCKFEFRAERKKSDSAKKILTEQIKQEMFGAQYLASVEQIAERMGYSRKHISKIFTEQTGETPTAYRSRKRIELAKSMLQYEQYSVSTIAEQLGYYDESAFSRAFKAATGLSPRAFRTSSVEISDHVAKEE